jgi:hypothetical protein
MKTMSNLLKMGPKKEVMLLNPEDYRYTSLQVERETESIVYCKKHDGVQYRFFKLGPGWTGNETRFLAVEGTPIISYITGKDASGQDTYAESQIIDYLKHALGDENYNKLEPAIKQRLSEHAIGTTVNIKPVIPDEDTQKVFDAVKAEGILYDADLDNLAKLGTATVTKKPIDRFMDKLPWMLAGMGLWPLLQALGVLK